MTNKPTEPREFWINAEFARPYPDENCQRFPAFDKDLKMAHHIHVIEKSAYLALVDKYAAQSEKYSALADKYVAVMAECERLKVELGKPYDKVDRLFENNKKLTAKLERYERALQRYAMFYSCDACQKTSFGAIAREALENWKP